MKITAHRSRTAFVAATVIASALLLGATVGTVAAGGGCTYQLDGATNLEVTPGMVACGGSGDDSVAFVDAGGTFNGGSGNDTVGQLFGTFNGGAGADTVVNLDGGVFNGASGADFVLNLNSGTFNGASGGDSVDSLYGGTFDGGPGTDWVNFQSGGTFTQ
jgi:hypothetical protein